jgi:hypothetical protein
MSEEEFAALGAGTVVFLRPVTAAQLVPFIPQAQTMPPDMEFSLIMSADGAAVCGRCRTRDRSPQGPY